MSTAAISGQGEIDFPIERSIREKLTKAFSPTHLEILNESHMHNVPRNSETHFKVVVISTDFDEVKLLKRHQAVNKVLGDELAGGVHALSIVAKTPEQWGKSNEIKPSPKCRGGSKA
jgi:stress-induced morphogen